MVLENLVDTIGKAKLPKFIANPKGSRQFQQFIKLGSKEHRNAAIEALAKYVPELATRNIYALLTIEKIVTYGLKTDEKFTTDKILKPAMTERKIVEQLLYNKLGCKFLNKLYLHPCIKPALKKQLLSIVLIPRTIELLGESREKLRQYYLETCKKCIDKELLGLELVQRIFKQAVTDFSIECDRHFNEELLSMAADGLPHLLASRDGVVAVVKLLSLASAKQKKNFIKELKGKFAEMAKNTVTCVVILRLLESVDDTVLLGKSVLSELVGAEYEKCKELLADGTGRVPFLFALDGCQTATGRYYYEPDKTLLANSPPLTTVKDAETRRSEIAAKLVPSIAKVVRSNLPEFVLSDSAKDVVLALLKNNLTEDKDELVKGAATEIGLLSNHPQPAVSIATMLLKEFPEVAGPACLSAMLSQVGSDDSYTVGLVASKAAFVLLQLLKIEAVSEHVKGLLVRSTKTISSITDENKGTELIKAELAKFQKTKYPSLAESQAAFPFSKQHRPVAEKPVAKKQKTAHATETGVQSLFEEEEEGEESWGLLGDDDELADLVGDDDEYI